MARPKAFDQQQALAAAIEVFSQQGFEGSSTDSLLKAMGISRQSLYDTFGDKWQLYLQALQCYTTERIGEQLRALNAGKRAIEGIEAYITATTEQAITDATPSCLGLSAVCEFGRSNPQVNLLSDTGRQLLTSSLQHRLIEAQQQGDITSDLSPEDMAQFINATLSGIKISARAGASADRLQGIVRVALRGLHP